MYHERRAADAVGAVTWPDVKRYLGYWSGLTPLTEDEVWLRWVFAFMSIHTTWRSNVKGFMAVKALPRDFTELELSGAIVSSGVGLHTTRRRAVWEFTRAFREDPTLFGPAPGETMRECRNRLARDLYGIGMAKTSFVFEMVYPVSCGVVCLDTHLLRLYGLSNSPSDGEYLRAESHWRRACNDRGVPAAVARGVYWDRLQGYELSDYWAWCLESNSYELKVRACDGGEQEVVRRRAA